MNKIYPQQILDAYIKYDLWPCQFSVRPNDKNECCGFGAYLVDYYGGVDKLPACLIAPKELCDIEYQCGFEAGFDMAGADILDVSYNKNRPGFMDGHNAGVLCFARRKRETNK